MARVRTMHQLLRELGQIVGDPTQAPTVYRDLAASIRRRADQIAVDLEGIANGRELQAAQAESGRRRQAHDDRQAEL